MIQLRDVLKHQVALWHYWYSAAMAPETALPDLALTPLERRALAQPAFAAKWAALMAGRAELAPRMVAETAFLDQEPLLRQAEPLAIHSDVWEIIKQASLTFEPEPLRAYDLVTTNGFALFPEPIEMLTSRGLVAQCRAIAWMPFSHTPLGGKQRARELADSELMDAVNDLSDEYGDVRRERGIALSFYASLETNDLPQAMQLRPAAGLSLVDWAPWWYGQSYAEIAVEKGGNCEAALRLVQVLFRLMQQPLFERSTLTTPKETRRSMGRRGFPYRQVTLIYLRRNQRHGAATDDEISDYHHRWIVSGHWRNHWYPSHGEHRQIWINPHIKGPEDKPLLMRERRAFVWTR